VITGSGHGAVIELVGMADSGCLYALYWEPVDDFSKSSKSVV
jgi:hypothetical protein